MHYKKDSIINKLKKRIIEHDEIPDNDLKRIKERYCLSLVTKYLQKEFKSVFKY